MDEEDSALSRNPVFQYFQDSELFDVAASNEWVVLVPSADSLGAEKIDRSYVETHIFKSSSVFQGDKYTTLDNKTIEIKDKKIKCVRGFKTQRTVSILMEELYYDENFESFKVLHINFPLIGRVPRAYLNQVIRQASSNTVPLERRTQKQHTEVISRFVGSQRLGASAQRFVQDFNNSYVMVKGFIKHTGNKVGNACTHIARQILHTKATKGMKVTKQDSHELLIAVQSTIMLAIYNKVWSGLTDMLASEDQDMQRLLMQLQHIDMQQLGIRSELICHPHKAVHRLRELDECVTPLQRLCCLQDTNKLMVEAVTSTYRDRSSGGHGRGGGNGSSGGSSRERDTLVLAADDILPLTVFVIIQSQSSHLVSTLEYVKHFPPNTHSHHMPLDSGGNSEGIAGPDFSHLAVHFTNYEGAIHYINRRLVKEAQKQRNGMISANLNHPFTHNHSTSTAVSSKLNRGITTNTYGDNQNNGYNKTSNIKYNHNNHNHNHNHNNGNINDKDSNVNSNGSGSGSADANGRTSFSSRRNSANMGINTPTYAHSYSRSYPQSYTHLSNTSNGGSISGVGTGYSTGAAPQRSSSMYSARTSDRGEPHPHTVHSNHNHQANYSFLNSASNAKSNAKSRHNDTSHGNNTVGQRDHADSFPSSSTHTRMPQRASNGRVRRATYDPSMHRSSASGLGYTVSPDSLFFNHPSNNSSNSSDRERRGHVHNKTKSNGGESGKHKYNSRNSSNGMNEAGNLNSSMNMSREHKMMNGSRQASASKSNGNQNSDNSSSIGGRINGTGHTNGDAGEDENELGDFLSQLRMSDDVVSGKRSDF